jgi:hypothetical protein
VASSAAVELHPQPAEPARAQQRQDLGALEHQLDAVAREERQEPRRPQSTRHEAGQVLLAQCEGQAVVSVLRATQLGTERAKAGERELVLRDRLERPPRGEPEQVAGAVAPGVRTVAARQQHD